MESGEHAALREYLLLGLGVIACLLGGGLGLSWLSWTGAGLLTADGLLWGVLVRRMRAEQLAWKKQAEEDQLQLVLRENQAREEGREALESYRSTIAHGLRMPIAVIQGYAELLRDGLVTEEETRRDYLNKISQRSQFMADLLSRRKNGDTAVDESRLEMDEQDLVALVRDICLDTQSYAATHGITIQVLHSVSSLEATVDKYLISRVLYNLLENAVKYMGRPGTVTVRMWPQQEWAVLDIQDDGMGLPSAEVEHIFDLHFQGSNRISGQGHGLYLVKKAVDAHHGKIEARSAPGRGLGLRIYLPKNIEKTEDERAKENKEVK